MMVLLRIYQYHIEHSYYYMNYTNTLQYYIPPQMNTYNYNNNNHTPLFIENIHQQDYTIVVPKSDMSQSMHFAVQYPPPMRNQKDPITTTKTSLSFLNISIQNIQYPSIMEYHHQSIMMMNVTSNKQSQHRWFPRRYHHTIQKDDIDIEYHTYRQNIFAIYFNDTKEENTWLYSDAYQHPSSCIYPSQIYSKPIQNCISFHETITLDRSQQHTNDDHDDTTISSSYNNMIQYQYLGHGYYRDVWMMMMIEDDEHYWNTDQSSSTSTNTTKLVLKQTRYDRTMNRNRYQKIRTEAYIMEELYTVSPSSYISTIYGYCGFSTIVQAGIYDISQIILPQHIEYQQWERGKISSSTLQEISQDHVFPLNNNVSIVEKLDILLQIISSMVEIHGFASGPIVLSDVALDQWIELGSTDSNADTKHHHIVLNDLDNAVLLGYNSTKQQYCMYESGYVGGYKAPEEHHYHNISETLDIWKIGSIIYSILTGLLPYYNVTNDMDVWDMYDAHILPYYDKRYETSHNSIEYELIQIMKLCYQWDPIDRIDIFDIYQRLMKM